MTDLFLKIFNISLSAVWIVCGVLAVRLLIRKAPKWVFPLLWGLVGLRLLLPTLPESSVSLLPSAEPVPEAVILSPKPAFHTQYDFVDEAVNPIVESSLTPAAGDSVNPMQVLVYAGSIVWCAGICAMLLYAAVSTIRLRLRMRTAVETDSGIYRTDRAPTPFILGVIRPRIYVPFSVGEESLSHVLAHERAHIRRRDHWIKPLSFLLLAVHWFNPFLWLAFILLCRDIELACDERVIRACTPEERAGYSEALLACSSSRRHPAALCPLAFGEVGVKARVKSVLSYKKPAFWVLVLSLMAAAILAVCFLTVPKETRNPAVGEYIPGVSVGNVDKEAYEAISPDFAIGADRNGYAVFVHPDKAFSSFRTLYADELGLLKERHQFPAFSKSTWRRYKKAGIEEVGENDAQTERLHFVSKFLDIWENSLGTLSQSPAAPTAEASGTTSMYTELDPAEVSEDLWDRARAMAKARSVTLREDQVLLRKDENGLEHYIFQSVEPGSALVLPDMEKLYQTMSLPTPYEYAWIDEPEACPVKVEIPFPEGSLTSAMGEERLRAYIQSVVGQQLLEITGGKNVIAWARVTALSNIVEIHPAANALGEGYLISYQAELDWDGEPNGIVIPQNIFMTFVCAYELKNRPFTSPDYVADVYSCPESELWTRTDRNLNEQHDIYEAVVREDFRRLLDDAWRYNIRTVDPAVPALKLVWGRGGTKELCRITDESLLSLDEGLLGAFLEQMEYKKQQFIRKGLQDYDIYANAQLNGAELLGEESFTGGTLLDGKVSEPLTVQLWRLDCAFEEGASHSETRESDGTRYDETHTNVFAPPESDIIIGILVRQTFDGPVYTPFADGNVTSMPWYLTGDSGRTIRDIYAKLEEEAGIR